MQSSTVAFWYQHFLESFSWNLWGSRSCTGLKSKYEHLAPKTAVNKLKRDLRDVPQSGFLNGCNVEAGMLPVLMIGYLWCTETSQLTLMGIFWQCPLLTCHSVQSDDIMKYSPHPKLNVKGVKRTQIDLFFRSKSQSIRSLMANKAI